MSSHSHSDFEKYDEFYRLEHIPMIARLPGYYRTRRYRLLSGFVTSSMKRLAENNQPEFLALHEFSGDDLPWEGLGEVQGTKWSQQIAAGMTNLDWGCFRLTKGFK